MDYIAFALRVRHNAGAIYGLTRENADIRRDLKGLGLSPQMKTETFGSQPERSVFFAPIWLAIRPGCVYNEGQ